jgi:hypothetical protein
MKRRPPGSNWGDYGVDDRIGRLNELTSERVVRAAAEIRTGRRFCLSLPLDYPGGNVVFPFRLPPERRVVDRMGALATDFPFSRAREGATGVVNDDIVTLWTQYSTQWDALAHVGSHFDADGDGAAEVVYYNGHYPGPDVDAMATAGLQGRGVMVDLRRKYGDAKTAVDFVMLEEVMREQGAVVEPGDVLALRTGWAQLLVDMKGSPDRRSCTAPVPGSMRAIRSCCNGSPRAASRRSWRTTSPSKPIRPKPAARVCRTCRCTSSACSSSASTWARCGISPSSRIGCSRTTERDSS